ncbi:hypothetical protein M2323_004562 [Rhodoblastus acidophilus]|uniref:hypothetical protein n=1 Tax=Rhodoblastus acidophilus TaxID=1074 RepID=UPI0022249093|nr:hypothetical protein [Rhodoblastus acidophilus]MCW2286773.1 hypothetical protein [Rhodoblastus acidophilus]MCW2335611.1 hypothetical protein [Rhodoblastus acidophilus]
MLKSTAAAPAGVFICEAASPAPALAQESSLQDVAGRFDRKKLPQVTIFRAKDIITLDPDKPSATAVAVLGDRILAVGSVDELGLDERLLLLHVDLRPIASSLLYSSPRRCRRAMRPDRLS